MRALVLAGLATLVMTGLAHAATVRVPADQPTLQAGIDAAGNLDSVLVAPGIYAGTSNKNLSLAGKSIVLVSETGAGATIIDCEGSGRGLLIESPGADATIIDGFTFRNGSVPAAQGAAINFQLASPAVRNCVFADNAAGGGGALYCHFASPAIEDCVFLRNSGNGGGVATVGMDARPTFRRCVFANGNGGRGAGSYSGAASSPRFEACIFNRNSATQTGGAIYSQSNAVVRLVNCTLHANAGVGAGVSVREYLGNPGHAVIENTIIAFSPLGEAVSCDATSTAQITCSDVFGNAGGDWTGCIASQLGENGNIAADPRFCGAPHDDFTIDETSPCAPANSGSCGLVGALPVGCGVIALEAVTWGRLKAEWR